ncbi:MAG: hypothetical protein PHE36_00530 [Novosphingobium sp.]|nr:hypothetical protein [Novosphingobium sp.]
MRDAQRLPPRKMAKNGTAADKLRRAALQQDAIQGRMQASKTDNSAHAGEARIAL